MSTPDLTTYRKLAASLADVLAAGKLRARQAVERERLTTYHEVGRLINDHLLEGKHRADYGARLVRQLAEDLDINHALLYDALQLYRCFPKVYARRQLGWGHYRAVLRLQERASREKLLREAEDQGWSTRELERRVRASLGAPEDTPTPDTPSPTPAFSPLRGLLKVFRGRDLPPSGRVVDLGFTVYLPPRELNKETVPKGAFLVNRTNRMYAVLRTRSRQSRHFTYLARVERVVDGDTLIVHIQNIFGVLIRQRVRLRGIDTPELGTKAGKRAKAFVEIALADHAFVGITSTKPDAYDRYLVDVFIPNENDRGQDIIDHGRCLNQVLLEEGLAKPASY